MNGEYKQKILDELNKSESGIHGERVLIQEVNEADPRGVLNTLDDLIETGDIKRFRLLDSRFYYTDSSLPSDIRGLVQRISGD